MKTELTAIKKDLTAISKKLENLLKAVEKSEKATVTKASKPKAVKATPAKKAPKAPVRKKAVKATATDQVLKIINRLKRGADTATLMKKTGFDQKKVRNILNRTFKQGKIKRVDKGIYVGVK
jgi:predicted Rossmann fold nucleotide-binding protein DprA/Smf involved in DNA uptake